MAPGDRGCEACKHPRFYCCPAFWISHKVCELSTIEMSLVNFDEQYVVEGCIGHLKKHVKKGKQEVVGVGDGLLLILIDTLHCEGFLEHCSGE